MKSKPILLSLCLTMLIANDIVATTLNNEGLPFDSLKKIDKNEAEKPIDFSADKLEHDFNSGTTRATGNVTLRNESFIVKADYVEYNAKTKDFLAKGNASIINEDSDLSWSGKGFYGNIETKKVNLPEFKVAVGGIFISSGDCSYEHGKDIVLEKGTLTTCDCAEPHYYFSAKNIRYHQNGDIEAWHLIGKVGEVPFFYLPYIYIDHRIKDLDVRLKLGYSSRWGGEFGIGKEFKPSENSRLFVMLDYYTKCGPGIESTFKHKDEKSETEISFTGRQDRVSIKYDDDDYDDGFYNGFSAEEWRYRAQIFQRRQFDETSFGDLSYRFKIDAVSDNQYIGDWERSNYMEQPQSTNYLEVALDNEYFILTGLIKPRLNSFETIAEKLPELRLDIPRINILNTPFQYESSSQVVVNNMRWRNYESPLYKDFNEYDNVRLNTKQFVYMPLNLFDSKIQFTPRAGFVAAYYNNTSLQKVDYRNLNYLMFVDEPNSYMPWMLPSIQYDNLGKAHSNFAAEVGFELSTKFHNTWGDFKASNLLCKIDGIRHIIEPYINYTATSKPTLDRDYIPFFDAEDQWEQQHFIQFGIKQRWQTRSNGRMFTFASLDMYANFHFEDEYQIYDRDEKVGDFGLRAMWRPNEQLMFYNESILNMNKGELDYNRFVINYMSKSGWDIGVGHLYTGKYTHRPAYSFGSTVSGYGLSAFNTAWTIPRKTSMLTFRTSTPLGDKMRIGYGLSYDLEDHNVRLHSISFVRNLHCWDFSVVGQMDSRNKWGVFFILSLTKFPKFSYQFHQEESR